CYAIASTGRYGTAQSERLVRIAMMTQLKEQCAQLTALQHRLRYLAAEEYPAWDALVEASPQGSVFCRSWWLQATSGDVRVLGYFPRNGNLAAGMPLYFERRFGLKVCAMPKLTQTWGVVMHRLSGTVEQIKCREMEIL